MDENQKDQNQTPTPPVPQPQQPSQPPAQPPQQSPAPPVPQPQQAPPQGISYRQTPAQPTTPKEQTPEQVAKDPARPAAFQKKREQELKAQAEAKKEEPVDPKVLKEQRDKKIKDIKKKLKKFLIYGGIVAFVGGLLFALYSTFGPNRPSTQIQEEVPKPVFYRKIILGGKELTVEVADSPAKRIMGLMDRESSELPSEQGMLFTFATEDTYEIWMKNMKFPIDIIWVNSDLEIVQIQSNAQPCPSADNCEVYTPETPSRYVIETNAGWTSQNNVGVGDTVEFLE